MGLQSVHRTKYGNHGFGVIDFTLVNHGHHPLQGYGVNGDHFVCVEILPGGFEPLGQIEIYFLI